MTEAAIEVLLQRAREKYPEAKPRIISDNGPQFIARDFKEFIRIAGMTHVRKLAKIGVHSIADSRARFPVRLIQTHVDHCNTVRLHSAIGHVTPHDVLAGRQAEIHATRNRRLEGSATPTSAPAGSKIAACTFIEHDYNDLAR
jgi:putative transposase